MSLHCLIRIWVTGGFLMFVQVCTDTKIVTNETMYGSIGERLFIPCRLQYVASKLRWRRGTILSSGLQINEHFVGHERYKLSGGGNYNLELIRATSEDFGEYSCEVQLVEGVEKGVIFLIETEVETTTNDDTSSSQIASGSKNQHTTAFSKTSGLLTAQKTENQTRIVTTYSSQLDNEGNGDKETLILGLSTRELLFYGLVVGGLILVLILSIGCNFYLNRKCKKGTEKREIGQCEAVPLVELGNDRNDQNIEVIENDYSGIENDYSDYHSINENEMLQMSDGSTAVKQQNKYSQRALPTIKQDHDIDVDDGYLLPISEQDENSNTCVKANSEILQYDYAINAETFRKYDYATNTENSQKCGTTDTKNVKKYGSEGRLYLEFINEPFLTVGTMVKFKSESNIVKDAPESCSIRKSRSQNGLCDGNKQITHSSNDLSPYVPLEINDMEYEHSYSPILN